MSTRSAPVAFDSASNEASPKLGDLSGLMGEEVRRRRRELRVVGEISAGMGWIGAARSVGNTAARIEVVGLGKEWSVLVDRSGRFGVTGWSVADGAVVFGILSSARSTERQSRRTWRD